MAIADDAKSSKTLATVREQLYRSVEDAFDGLRQTGTNWTEDRLSQALASAILSLDFFECSDVVEQSDGSSFVVGQVSPISPLRSKSSERRVIAFKPRNVLEKEHGDICVIVDLATEAGRIQGTAFFEAKLTGPKWSIPALDKGQAVRICTKTLNPYLVLYHDSSVLTNDSFTGSAISTSVTVTPLDLMIDNASMARSVNEDFAGHLIWRCMRGFELDTRKHVVKRVFDLGARYYLHIRVTKARTLKRAIELARELKEFEVPVDIIEMQAQLERGASRTDRPRDDRKGKGPTR